MTGILTDQEIDALREKACELDVYNGGHCDWRLGAVNFWSSPEDCPEGQEHLVYLKGAIGYPRNFIGTVYFADLAVDTINYEKMRQETGNDSAYDAASKPYVDQPEDIVWVTAQWEALWQAAIGTRAPALTAK